MKHESIRIAFQPTGTRVNVKPGLTVLETGREAGLILTANCGGNGICGRCRVTIMGGNAPEPVEAERLALGDKEIAAGQRLACRARLNEDTEVSVPATTLGNQQRLQLEGVPGIIQPDERVREFIVAGKRPLGVAIDLGCTKIAAYLLDLQTGEQLAAKGIPNPQISYGEDLISRLVVARQGRDQAKELAGIVKQGVGELIETLTARAGVEPDQIADICVVGNTAMTHLFLELGVDGLLTAPFTPATTSAWDDSTSALGIDLPENVPVHVLPAIGSFVGADHVAMILANGLHHVAHTALGIDIGTNTEIVLASGSSANGGGNLLTSSCPAGPTFEGGHIRHGMRAAPGAIERIALKNGEMVVKTIGDLAPVGLCGSGVIDAIALLLETGAIDYRGHLQAESAGVRQGDAGREYVLIEAADTGHGRDIVVTQGDISEVQLAKAAVAASVITLLTFAGIRRDQVQEVVLAGAFGSYLDLKSSIAIGLLPHFPNASYLQAGNSAGTGARMALVSNKMRREAAEIADSAELIDLKKQASFNRELVLATRFPRPEPIEDNT
jgi:uncharacterized 2Fe-2S/4Fe-4S cluster protein (DUF4445 family)